MRPTAAQMAELAYRFKRWELACDRLVCANAVDKPLRSFEAMEAAMKCQSYVETIGRKRRPKKGGAR